jgi:hypothetical protein
MVPRGASVSGFWASWGTAYDMSRRNVSQGALVRGDADRAHLALGAGHADRGTRVAEGDDAALMPRFERMIMFRTDRPDRQQVPGYLYGSPSLPRSPISLPDLELLKTTILFGGEDVTALRLAREVVQDQIEDILDVWYGFVGSHPHLAVYFSNKAGGELDAHYLARVRARFGQWILDTLAADYDQTWLDYQEEVARRHHRPGKNQTDSVSSVDHIHFRYLVAFVMPISATMEPFLAKKGHPAEVVRKMQAAWTKAVLLTAILWSRPYVANDAF